MTRQDILNTAYSCVVGDRDRTYGAPENSFELIATLWNDWLNYGLSPNSTKFNLTPKDVAVMMMLLKIARIKGTKAHGDNWVDIAGYAACGGEIEDLLNS